MYYYLLNYVNYNIILITVFVKSINILRGHDDPHCGMGHHDLLVYNMGPIGQHCDSKCVIAT